MIVVKVDKKEIDFSKVKVGCIMDLNGKYEDKRIEMVSAIVKAIDTKNNEITVEPNTERNKNQFLGFSNNIGFQVDCGMKLSDKEGNILINTLI